MSLSLGQSVMYAAEDSVLAYLLSNSGAASTLAVQTLVKSYQQQRQAPYQILASDYLQADTGTDQSAGWQAALNAAAAKGADLLLPTGVITATKPVNWKCHVHNLIGSQGTVIDCSGATIDGPILNLDGARSPNQNNVTVMTSRLSNIFFRGPKDANTTVDAVGITGHTLSGNSIYGLLLDQIAYTGFRHHEVFGDYAWVVGHNQVYYNNHLASAVLYKGTETTGENISWDNCSFANGAGGIETVDGTGLDMSFKSCSFDYLTGPSIKAYSGNMTLIGCHLENGLNINGNQNDSMPPFLDLYSDTSGTRTPSATLIGGVVVTEGVGSAGGATAPLGIVVRTTTTGGTQPPIVVTAAGVQLGHYASQTGPLTFHVETNSAIVPTNWAAPKITMMGNVANYRGNGLSYMRIGAFSNLLANGDFGSALNSGAPAYNVGIGKGWYSNDPAATLDTTQHVSGTQCAKVLYSTAAPDTPPLNQNFIAQPMGKYHTACWVKTDGVTWGSRHGVWIWWYAPDGTPIGNSYCGDFSYASGTTDWTMRASFVTAPAAAAFGRLGVWLTGTVGTVWLDDVEVCLV